MNQVFYVVEYDAIIIHTGGGHFEWGWYDLCELRHVGPYFVPLADRTLIYLGYL